MTVVDTRMGRSARAPPLPPSRQPTRFALQVKGAHLPPNNWQVNFVNGRAIPALTMDACDRGVGYRAPVARKGTR